MSTIKIKIDAFGAVGQQLPQDLEIICPINSTVATVLDQVGQEYPDAMSMIQRCACAIGEDIISRQRKLNLDMTLVLLSPVAGG